MLEKPWWEIWPGRLESELKALEASNIAYDITFKKPFLRLKLNFPYNGKPIVLYVNFPALYPFFRPEIVAEPGLFSRHQNPIIGNLCLLGRRTENWNSNWTVSELLNQRFGELERAAKTTDQIEREALEEPQGEPITQFYAYDLNSIILVDVSDRIDIGREGGALKLSIQSEFLPTIHGQIVDVRGRDGRKLAAFNEVFSRGKHIQGTWIRVSRPPLVSDARQFEQQLIETGAIQSAKNTYRIGDFYIDIVGILTEEEVQQGVMGDAWMFLVRTKDEKSHQRQTTIVRQGRIGPSDFAARVPAFSSLKKKNITIVGLGSIGAPIAIELARLGVGKILLIDYDFVEPGSVVRWPLGMSMAGLQKSKGLKNFIKQNYPYTQAEAFDYRFGYPGYGTEENFNKLLSTTDLIIDATAEFGVHQFLSLYAKTKKIPYLLAYITPGGYGGLTACIDPRKQMGCWGCLQAALYEQKSIPEPPVLEAAEMQPPGCAERTAIFPGFDATEISLQVVRTAASVLVDKSDDQYPKINWDVAIVSFRSRSGDLIPPSWTTYSLGRICNDCK